MRPRRERQVLTLDCVPALNTHVRLQYDPVRRAWVLLGPEKVFWPDDVSLDILRLCDGTHSVRQILQSLAAQYDAPLEDISADAQAFLQEWSDRFLVRL